MKKPEISIDTDREQMNKINCGMDNKKIVIFT